VYVVRITRADIGARVVIRRRIAGPVPLTDVIGTLQSWTAGVLRVVGADGTVTAVPEADLVAAKVVPPRPDKPRFANRRSEMRPPPGRMVPAGDAGDAGDAGERGHGDDGGDEGVEVRR